MTPSKLVKVAYGTNANIYPVPWQIIFPNLQGPEVAIFHRMENNHRIVILHSFIRDPLRLQSNWTAHYLLAELESLGAGEDLGQVDTLIIDSLEEPDLCVLDGLIDTPTIFDDYCAGVGGPRFNMTRNADDEALNKTGEVIFSAACTAVITALAHNRLRGVTGFRAYGINWSTAANANGSLQELNSFANRLTDLTIDCSQPYPAIEDSIDRILRTASRLTRLELVFEDLPKTALSDSLLLGRSFDTLQFLKLGGCRISSLVLEQFLLKHIFLVEFLMDNSLVLHTGGLSRFFDFATTTLHISIDDLVGRPGSMDPTLIHRRGWHKEI